MQDEPKNIGRVVWGWAVLDALGWRLERRTRLMKEALFDNCDIITLYADAPDPSRATKNVSASQRILIEDIIRIEGLAGIQRLGREKMIYLSETDKLEIIENRINEILITNGLKKESPEFSNLSRSLLNMIYNDVTPDDLKSVTKKNDT
jgi:hypothetical protein